MQDSSDTVFSTGKYLVVDASRNNFQVGILKEGTWEAFSEAESPVLSALDLYLKPLMKAHPLEDFAGIIYCQGPGSTMGLRATLSLMGAWKVLLGDSIKFFYFNALEYIAIYLATSNPLIQNFFLVSPARPGCYHSCEFFQGGLKLSIIDKLPDASQSLFYLPQMKVWKANDIPQHAVEIDYSIAHFPMVLKKSQKFLWPIEEPELAFFGTTANHFIEWDRKRHSGPIG